MGTPAADGGRWPKPVAICGACGRQRPCYHARTPRPLCCSCYRRENIARWKIAKWVKPIAACSRCGAQGPAWFAKTDAPLCGRCHAKQRPRRPPPTIVALCPGCQREERICEVRADGTWSCRTCIRGAYTRTWSAPLARCSVCDRERPCYGARGDRPVCTSCRRRELHPPRTAPRGLATAVCSQCNRECDCHYASSELPVCPACRPLVTQPRSDTCRACGRHKPCYNAGSDRAICLNCAAHRDEPREPCVRCGQPRRVYHQAAGHAECERCATARIDARGTCQACGRTLRPAASDPTRCEHCAGEQPLRGCRRCGEQVPYYDDRRCPPCALQARLADLRAGADSDALTVLEPYLAALQRSPNPGAVVRWLRVSAARRTLLGLLDGTIEISHEALDAVDDHLITLRLRDALIAADVLDARLEQTAAFQRAAGRLLARVPDGEPRTQLRAFATWQLQHQLLRRERRGLTTRASAGSEISSLRTAVQLTLFAHQHDLTLAELTQADLDLWIAQAPAARRRVADFLDWAQRAQITRALQLPPRSSSGHVDQLPDLERLRFVRRLLDDEDLDLRDRVGGLFVLLLAQPVSRLLLLTASHIDLDARPITVHLGRHPLELPEPIDQLAAQLARQAHRQARQPPPGRTAWLFPGTRLDKPLTSEQFRARLRALGITPLPARTGALLALAATLPPAILADMLGISEGGAADWTRLAAGDWNSYAAHASRRYQAPPR